MGRCSLLLAVFACGCVSLTPNGARVSVYRASLDGLPSQRSMPEGCRLLVTKPSMPMSELDMEGQKDPFRVERNEAGAAGANALLVLSRMTMSRRDPECPTSSPITDCPPSVGAWFRVVIESYACTPDALRKLSTPPPTTTVPTSEDERRDGHLRSITRRLSRPHSDERQPASASTT
jgi:hypothetical protein